MKARVREMEAEAAKLQEMQAAVSTVHLSRRGRRLIRFDNDRPKKKCWPGSREDHRITHQRQVQGMGSNRMEKVRMVRLGQVRRDQHLHIQA